MSPVVAAATCSSATACRAVVSLLWVLSVLPLLLIVLVDTRASMPRPQHPHAREPCVVRHNETCRSPEFAIVVCRGDSATTKNSGNDFQRQLRQVAVLLKSAAALTSRTLKFHIVSDSLATHHAVTNLTQGWPDTYTQRVVFGQYKEVFYPPGTEKLKKMFRPCATERLFLAQAYEDKDTLVFLDTDTLFLRPPEDLWCQISNFRKEQIMGIAPCLYYYGRHFRKERAAQLYKLGCEWNYRQQLCAGRRNKCKYAEKVGVGLLHGAAMTFVNGKDQKLQAVFEAWEQYQLDAPLLVFASSLKATLTHQGKAVGCTRMRGVDEMLLKGLMDTV